MLPFIRSTLNPAWYHGHRRRPPFFEGWYYKMVSADESRRFAIIPGVFLGANGHAFVQVLDGVSGRSAYHRFPLEAFAASAADFDIRVATSEFRGDHIRLDIDRPEGQMRGELAFDRPRPWPVSFASPGVMGWFAWVPFMECYHGVLSFDHAIQGWLELDGERVDFSGGRGYMEKDWGQAFPQGYIWFQSNHFEQPGVCLTGSAAIIPWLGSAFPGFIVGLWVRGKLYRFATYTGAHIEDLEMRDDCVRWTLCDRRYCLAIQAQRAEGGLLLGPTRAAMGQRVNETLNATLEVTLATCKGEVLFDGVGRHAGLEVHGDVARLQRMAG